MTARISTRRLLAGAAATGLLAGGAALGMSGVAAAAPTPTSAPSVVTGDHHGHHDRCEWKKGHWEKKWVPGHWVKKWVNHDTWHQGYRDSHGGWHQGHHSHDWKNQWVYVPGHWDHQWVKAHWDCHHR
ncbi:hypothetical protein ACFWA4_01565 [Streptomyces sp. NPDC060011]|uniref:hypothetical protein n=1 Tax=unclassified Streptomyces TaxID=2593676 RepID=UPI0013B77421|nr:MULTISPECIES: hypothetical protein [unclassified Streptomyces]MCX4912373.1 hypothetical protein [Streptomyces sp. NBC_00687]MCX5136847.1 hypothetical protein [Streptomyces sp. NBC_00340]MCX5285203.1 hypothetical protein [Streptomyces sp. NBC_00198]NEB28791.1 hypothetical protein [Streptomyces sp. SID14446]WSD82509.1 hypothetical protein OHB33_39760 [Streptomyces sp. NBC_01558]